MKTAEQIIEVIKETKRLYETHALVARARLKKRMNEMTAQQVQVDLAYITDMEARGYAMTLLLEELEA